MSLLYVAPLSCLLFTYLAAADTRQAGLRVLLQNEQNQDIITNLGTRYEIVHPVQIRQDWEPGLSTKVADVNNTVVHLQQTSFLIETHEHKFHLDLELNTNLFAPTLVQFLYLKGASPIALNKLPENCYYHARIRNYPGASAAFKTCDGIKGIIFLGEKIFYIHPLHGNHSGNHPHLLYHYFPDDIFRCASSAEENLNQENVIIPNTQNGGLPQKRYIETAFVVDQSLFEKYRLPPKDVVTAAVEIMNYVDLLYRPLNTYVSLVYVELWIDDQVKMDSNMNITLHKFKDYAAQRISRISVDTVHLLTGLKFQQETSGLAFSDSICTANAVGLTKVDNAFHPHLTSFALAHMIGHNLGMNHDQTGCSCEVNSKCIMGNNIPFLSTTLFSNCSIGEYLKTLKKGYGVCLFNMPTMRMSICGNSILEEQEECDCGTVEECVKSNPCCDPMTCRLIKHAQCSSGPCCRKCKLLSPDHLCRPSKGECDIPEFCDGKQGQCPEDTYKRNGAVCSEGHGYCFQGLCPVLKQQCREIWGKDADSADSVCFERLNILGTPNGNCGSDGRGEIRKCKIEDASCGSLQCSQGEKSPVTLDNPPIHFAVNKINTQGIMHECKTRTFTSSDLLHGLVKDGTKCGYQKICLNQICTSVRDIVTGKCPLEEILLTCSAHGTCTNLNTCVCEEGWKGHDCGIVDEDSYKKKDMEYYDSIDGISSESPYHGHNEIKLNPNLAITVIAAAIVIGVGLVVIVILFFFYRHM